MNAEAGLQPGFWHLWARYAEHGENSRYGAKTD